jgi:2-oxoglutarate ferredoxin oxidoreductase subunit alpha
MLVNENKLNLARLISILHYDGTPITARFIVDQISKHAAGALPWLPFKKATA